MHPCATSPRHTTGAKHVNSELEESNFRQEVRRPCYEHSVSWWHYGDQDLHFDEIAVTAPCDLRICLNEWIFWFLVRHINIFSNLRMCFKQFQTYLNYDFSMAGPMLKSHLETLLQPLLWNLLSDFDILSSFLVSSYP